MAVSNSLVQSKANTKMGMTAYLTQDAVKDQINKVIGGKNGTRFITAIISAVNNNEQLQQCTNQSILSAALLGESLNLSPSPMLGYYYLVPFNDKNKGKVAQFQIGYKGLIQLAIRSGQYKKINVMAIKMDSSSTAATAPRAMMVVRSFLDIRVHQFLAGRAFPGFWGLRGAEEVGALGVFPCWIRTRWVAPVSTGVSRPSSAINSSKLLFSSGSFRLSSGGMFLFSLPMVSHSYLSAAKLPRSCIVHTLSLYHIIHEMQWVFVTNP